MKFLVLCTFIAGAAAAYSNSVYPNGKAGSGLYNQVPDGSDYADKFPHGSTGYNGGYTTHYSTPNGGGVAVGTGSFAGAPGFGGYPTVDFNNFFQGVQANFANSMTHAYSGPGATVKASAALSNPSWMVPPSHGAQVNLYQQQFAFQQQLFAQQQAALNAGFAAAGFGPFGPGSFPVYGPNFATGNFNRIPSGNFGGAPNVASSSASFGPGGFHQTASIYPNNPAVPNIDTRFGGSDQTTTYQSGKPGFVGVSSFSSSSNINGQTHREAITSVNDNGKVTTHRVHS